MFPLRLPILLPRSPDTLAGAAVCLALDWPWKAKLFPLVIAIPVFCMAAAEVIWGLLYPADRTATLEFQLTDQGAGRDTVRRTLQAVAWMFSFFLAIVLLGFQAAIPLMVFSYLKLQGRERWALSGVFAISVWAAVYVVFGRILHLPFPDGLALQWLILA